MKSPFTADTAARVVSYAYTYAGRLHLCTYAPRRGDCARAIGSMLPGNLNALCMFGHRFLSLLMICADGGYAGKLEEFVRHMGRLFGHGTGFGLGLIRKLEEQKGFVVLARRWVI